MEIDQVEFDADETEEGELLEVGSVKVETKGMALGIAHDPGFGWVFP